MLDEKCTLAHVGINSDIIVNTSVIDSPQEDNQLLTLPFPSNDKE